MDVNKEVFDNKWEQIRAQTKAWWGLFSDDDLDKVAKAPVKRDKYAMMLRVKYGYSHERAREEISKRITGLEISPPNGEFASDSPDQPDSAKVSKVQKNRTKKSNP
ncbi:MAG TPA: hypothetical protein VFY25_04745 [Anaerolineales bacterium]|nr:hypothetical protein [Anaerolineales bacterium]